jgi:hypothetical protein
VEAYERESSKGQGQRPKTLDERVTRLERIVIGDAELKQPGLYEMLTKVSDQVDKIDRQTDQRWVKLTTIWGTIATVGGVLGWILKH